MGKDWGSLRVLKLSVSWVCCLSEGSGSRVYVVVWVREGSRNVFKVGFPGVWVCTRCKGV